MHIGDSRRRSPSILLIEQDYRKDIVEFADNDRKLSFSVLHSKIKRNLRSRARFLVIIFFLLAIFSISLSIFRSQSSLNSQLLWNQNQATYHLPPQSIAQSTIREQPTLSQKISTHPIWKLIRENEIKWESLIAKQSQSLSKAVTEYRRRYGIPPPPNFDKWYEFAKARNVQLIDEYDNIQETLAPFWGLKPATIRARAREAIGFDSNNMIGVLIRNGEIKKIAGGGDWQMNATAYMIKDFIHHLPDMDLAFNIHDEPRVLVPHDDLSRLVSDAEKIGKVAAKAVLEPRNRWSERPPDLNDGSRFEDVKRTRFNVFAHQPTWSHSRMSCPPNSPSRILEDGPKVDNIENYATGELEFIYNHTAFSDICQSPSFSETYGFFDRPNAFNVAHDLIPVFSQSKISSFNDIIYPSPWYWSGKVPYEDSKDMPWSMKKDQMYWRGSTTGGFSRDGSWRRQHRQHMVKKINSNDMAKILINTSEDGNENWQVKAVLRSDYKELFDVHFSHIGQCDPGDCTAQKEFFGIKALAKQNDAWRFKYLIDIDGNAFSGRFYAFLKSKSLVYKLALFREWHSEWLKPWVHYIPMTLRGEEWLEAVRWFAGEDLGKKKAEKIATQGREWANKILRNEDLEVWFFRLLLEYGRLVDENRESVGFVV
ncbi:Beta-1,2-xylosyltransferase 1 [Golovinomyces cichoracearum]|uniref:Beta-1,2-xylosyltransferase 1 n=1 Tax=Golovinomyces cichoracearum TaxID=62708 RepID=A0A420HG20_9PEZI|nr:Beta-1,2-xylosyltransferase 1 [Golovinomyces cichoracearum]